MYSTVLLQFYYFLYTFRHLKPKLTLRVDTPQASTLQDDTLQVYTLQVDTLYVDTSQANTPETGTL